MEKIWWGKVDAKGRVTIPAELRRQLGLRPGTVVVFWEEAGGIMVQSLKSWKQQQRTRKKT
jgi:AbrB family looped-hinge helix DNA binding protein